jgi:hypothetical protein
MAELTYLQLRKQVRALGKQVTRDNEAIQHHAQWIASEAEDTARVADTISALGVDPDTVSETRELGRTMMGVASAAFAYAAAGDVTARSATAADDQAHDSHDGINEAYSRATVDVSNLDREWLRQE